MESNEHLKNNEEASLVEGTESQMPVPQNQVKQNEISQVFSTQDIDSNMPNNSETRVERQEQKIHEQSQQNSQESQQPGTSGFILHTCCSNSQYGV